MEWGVLKTQALRISRHSSLSRPSSSIDSPVNKNKQVKRTLTCPVHCWPPLVELPAYLSTQPGLTWPHAIVDNQYLALPHQYMPYFYTTNSITFITRHLPLKIIIVVSPLSVSYLFVYVVRFPSDPHCEKWGSLRYSENEMWLYQNNGAGRYILRRKLERALQSIWNIKHIVDDHHIEQFLCSLPGCHTFFNPILPVWNS